MLFLVCINLLFFFAVHALLDEAPSLLPPFAFGHAGWVVEEFFGGIFLVKATRFGRVSGDIPRQLHIVIRDFKCVQ